MTLNTWARSVLPQSYRSHAGVLCRILTHNYYTSYADLFPRLKKHELISTWLAELWPHSWEAVYETQYIWVYRVDPIDAEYTALESQQYDDISNESQFTEPFLWQTKIKKSGSVMIYYDNLECCRAWGMGQSGVSEWHIVGPFVYLWNPLTFSSQ